MMIRSKIKLSDKQKNIIRLMREGWACGIYPRYKVSQSNSGRLQEGGLGKGGSAIRVSVASIKSLFNKGIVGETNRIRLQEYVLTELGKTIEL